MMAMRIDSHISLKPYNTFGIDVTASAFAEVNNVEELKGFIHKGILKDQKHLILGGGSNVLFAGDYDGLVLLNKIRGIEEEMLDDGRIRIKAGAGMDWDDLVHYCIEKGYGGIENLVAIPGTVGAGPIQNIGAYGVELKDVFHSLEAIEMETAELMTFFKSDCAFGYRDSIFKRALKGRVFITSVSLDLKPGHEPDVSYGAVQDEINRIGGSLKSIADVAKAIENIRGSKLPDPQLTGNAGSFFKNPVIEENKYLDIHNRYPEMPSYKGEQGQVKIPAGWMIEQCGWKGKSLGNTAVHDKQALVLVNKGNASGQEVIELAEKIKKSVLNEFGIELEFEVNVI
jgi:UDP-N-acetylmuramate dehydrogenase